MEREVNSSAVAPMPTRLRMKSKLPPTDSVAEVRITDSAGSKTVSASGIETSTGASCSSACSPRISIHATMPHAPGRSRDRSRPATPASATAACSSSSSARSGWAGVRLHPRGRPRRSRPAVCWTLRRRGRRNARRSRTQDGADGFGESIRPVGGVLTAAPRRMKPWASPKEALPGLGHRQVRAQRCVREALGGGRG